MINNLKLLESLLYISEVYVWLKGLDSKYVYCSPKWKKIFFNKDEDFNIEGKTDIELLNDYRKKTNPIHDYGDLCLSTDDHSNKLKMKCRYIEGGFIGNRLFILDVIKTPMIVDDKVMGNIGFAIDRSNQVTQILSEIELARKLNLLEQLTPTDYNSSPFVYWIKTSQDFRLRDLI